MLIDTKATTKAANDANAATLKAIAQEHTNSQRGLRAYVSVLPDGINTRIDDEDRMMAHIFVKNAGQIIAKNIRVVVHARISSDRNDSSFFFPTDEELRPIGSLHPGSEVRRGSVEVFTEMDVDHAYEYGLFFFVWGTVRYDDGFGKPRYTNFCHRYNAHAREVSNDRFFISKDVARNHETGNDVD